MACGQGDLTRTLASATEYAQSLSGEDLGLVLKRKNGPVFLDGIADALAVAVAMIPVDASGADLSDLNVSDLAAIVDVIWTRDTVWPKKLARKVRAQSREIRPGLFQVGRARGIFSRS
jgi:hypothetical protein